MDRHSRRSGQYRRPPQLIPSLSLLKAQKEACERAKVFMCKYCARPFVRQQAFKDHASTCQAQAESIANQRTKVPIRWGSDIAKDPVHKPESRAYTLLDNLGV